MVNFQSDIIDLQSEISHLHETLLINDFKVFKEGLEYTTEQIQSINEGISDKVAKVVAKGKELLSYINTMKVKYKDVKLPDNVGKTIETEYKKVTNVFEALKKDPSKENSKELQDQIAASKKVLKALKFNSSIKNEAADQRSIHSTLFKISVTDLLGSLATGLSAVIAGLVGMTGLSLMLASAAGILLYISFLSFIAGVIVYFASEVISFAKRVAS
jgi:hypothetical protein